MGRIIHFELTVDDPQASARFYEAAFGWQSEPSPFLPEYLTSLTGEGAGIDGAVMSSRYQQQPVILWIEVDDLAASVAAVESAGGHAVGEVNDIPGQGAVTYVADPQGLLYGLRQPLQIGPPQD